MSYLDLALSQVGIGEIEGVKDNPEILKYFNVLGFDGAKLKDETAWCSAYVNWVMKESCLDHTGKLNARSWLKIGEEITEPKIGDIVVFWRESESSWKGHVGFFISEVGDWIYCLGGNQGNSVNISRYPKRRLLGYRRITKTL